MNVLMNEYIDGLCFLMNRWVDCSWMNEWMNEIIMIVFMNEWMEYHLKDEWFIVFVNEQMNGWMNEWMCENRMMRNTIHKCILWTLSFL